MILSSHARQLLAVHGAIEIKDDGVALLRRAILFQRLGVAVVAGQVLDGLRHFIVRHVDRDALQLELREVHGPELGQQLDLHLVFEVFALLELGDFDLRLHRGTQAALVQCLARAVVDRLFKHLAHHGLAVALL